MTRAVLAACVAIRLAVAAAAWTVTDPARLLAWDIGRFSEVAEGGRPWIDHAVEYPPLMVGAIVATFSVTDSLAEANRLLIATTLVADLLTALIVYRAASDRAALWYLGVGLVLLPEQYLRLEVLPGILAAAALAMVLSRPRLAGGFAALGAAAKVWPALLLVGFLAARRLRAAAGIVVAGGLMVMLWVALFRTDAIGQVISLRAATGWQAETLPGSLAALADPTATVRLELDAYRIGTLVPWVVTALRAVAVAAMAVLATIGWRAGQRDVVTVATATLGAVAALLVTAPLLSTQFLLWLSVPAAFAVGHDRLPTSVAASGLATVITGITLKVVGPAGVAAPLAAASLLVRDAALIVVVLAAGYELAAAGRAGA